MKDEDDSTSAALQLLAAVRHPVGDQLINRIELVDKLLPWFKVTFGLVAAVCAALVHAELKLAKIPENTDAIHELKTTQDTNRFKIAALETSVGIIQLAKNGYDVNVVPKIATWDRTSEEWKAFSSGAESDMGHLHEMWWMKTHGVTNKDTTPTPFDTGRK